ncbi:helix-turn-helix domain-containing protein [Rhizobium leguminosarum]|uniref:helix-turn-helix domain-containing protein n=1 Tax=Rhizobium leguminosarum TaxID=384 RepID=UPI0024A92DBB|nr:helix-turn-helix domain-containing protein [Rhizobium leguminosarum]MDI5929593.1 helix-turn-helix domain-containing protein [Rhizobium leguminosarum]
MIDPKIERAALNYARFTQPLNPDLGWRREDVQLAFMAGVNEQPIRRLLPIREVAELLAVSAATIRDLVRHGELAHVKVDRGTERSRLIFAADEIENFIKRHTQRDCAVSPAKTTMNGTRKRAHDLAVDRVIASGGGFMAQYEARRAAVKAKGRK